MKPLSGTAHIEGPFCFLGCPREIGRGCAAQVSGPDAEWKNLGTAEAPTLNQSYNCIKGCGWHGYVVDGKLIDAPKEGISTMHICAHCNHPEIHTVHIAPKQMPNGSMGIQVAFSKTEVRPVTGA